MSELVISPLSGKKILMLDDTRKAIERVEKWFKDRKLELETSSSVERCLEKIQSGQVDIFICDLVLDKIEKNLRGSNILENIRSGNKQIFLALYSAYINDYLPSSELERLRHSGISVHFKNDETFIDEIEDEFIDFKKDGIETVSQNNYDRKVKELVLKQLYEISDKQTLVPIPKFDKSITIQDLIDSISNDKLEGILFVEKWLEALHY